MRRGSVRWRGMVVLVGVLIACLGGFGGWLGWRYWDVRPLHADYPPPPPPERTVYFDSATYTVTEGGTVIITVLLSSAADETVTVDYEASHEYVGVIESGTITFEPGSTAVSREVSTTDNMQCTGTISITLRLSNPLGGGTFLGDRAQATLEILDDDLCDCGACGTCGDGCGP